MAFGAAFDKRFRSLIPETKGRSLEEMDVIFGSVSAEERQAYIDKREQRELFLLLIFRVVADQSLVEFEHADDPDKQAGSHSERSESVDRKV